MSLQFNMHVHAFWDKGQSGTLTAYWPDQNTSHLTFTFSFLMYFSEICSLASVLIVLLKWLIKLSIFLQMNPRYFSFFSSFYGTIWQFILFASLSFYYFISLLVLLVFCPLSKLLSWLRFIREITKHWYILEFFEHSVSWCKGIHIFSCDLLQIHLTNLSFSRPAFLTVDCLYTASSQ